MSGLSPRAVELSYDSTQTVNKSELIGGELTKFAIGIGTAPRFGLFNRCDEGTKQTYSYRLIDRSVARMGYCLAVT